MYYNDHMPPHFHAEYNGQKALVDINNIRDINAFKEACTVMNGTLAWDILVTEMSPVVLTLIRLLYMS